MSLNRKIVSNPLSHDINITIWANTYTGIQNQVSIQIQNQVWDRDVLNIIGNEVREQVYSQVKDQLKQALNDEKN